MKQKWLLKAGERDSSFFCEFSSELKLSRSCVYIYIYNAEFTTAVMLVCKTVEIEGNEFQWGTNFNQPEFICPLNWDLHTNTAVVEHF